LAESSALADLNLVPVAPLVYHPHLPSSLSALGFKTGLQEEEFVVLGVCPRFAILPWSDSISQGVDDKSGDGSSKFVNSDATTIGMIPAFVFYSLPLMTDFRWIWS